MQIVGTSLDIDSRKPQTENRQEPEPEAPSPIDKHHPHPTEAIQVGRRGHQGQQDAHRPLGKDSRKDEEGHASRALHPTGDSRLHVVQRAESEDDKEGHEHVHTHKHHRAGKERGGEQHGLCRAPIRLWHAFAYPPVHDSCHHQRRKEREQHEPCHAVVPQQPLASHHDPQIERRFVGISHTVVGKCEKRMPRQRLIGNAQVAQLVGRGKIAPQHQWYHRHNRHDIDYMVCHPSPPKTEVCVSCHPLLHHSASKGMPRICRNFECSPCRMIKNVNIFPFPLPNRFLDKILTLTNANLFVFASLNRIFELTLQLSYK